MNVPRTTTNLAISPLSPPASNRSSWSIQQLAKRSPTSPDTLSPIPWSQIFHCRSNIVTNRGDYLDYRKRTCTSEYLIIGFQSNSKYMYIPLSATHVPFTYGKTCNFVQQSRQIFISMDLIWCELYTCLVSNEMKLSFKI